MSRTATIIIGIVLAGASTVRAQAPANPLSANFKASWTNIGGLLARMAEKMPEADYRFKPTPEMQDFGVRMAHIIGANMRGCATAKGEQKPLTFSAAPTKAEIVTAAEAAKAYCDGLFNSLTDADLMKTVAAGRGGQRPVFAILQGSLEHSQEMYGYMAPYLRLKGIVPPSSEHNEH